MTVTTPLTCEGFAAALADYLERDDTPRVRTAMESHAAACAECGALLADLQRLRVDASGLATLSPSRDLWSGIAERIEAPVIALGRTGESARSRNRVHVQPWLRPVAAAAALVVITAGVTYVATREALTPQSVAVDSTTIDPREIAARAFDSAQRAAGGVETIASADPVDLAPVGAPATSTTRTAPGRGVTTAGARPVGTTLVGNTTPVVATLEPVYGREIERLRRIIDERRGLLDTATVGVIERNLTIIDRAIQESRAALARDPASALLNDQLNSVLEQKVELLRAAVLLPVRT